MITLVLQVAVDKTVFTLYSNINLRKNTVIFLGVPGTSTRVVMMVL